jgi:hypothetical protein
MLVVLSCSFGSQLVVAEQPAAKPAIDPVVRKAADALGMVRWDDFARGPDRENLDLINRMEILATGTGHEVRRGGVWPEYVVKQLVLGVSLLTPAVRMDVVRQDVSGKESRTIQVVRGNLAWDESEPGVGSGLALPATTATERMRQIYLLPHGFLRAVLRSPAADVTVSKNAAGDPVLGVRIDGALAHATLDKDYRPARIELPVTDPLLGKVTLQVELSGYKDFDGYEVFFPTHLVQKLNGRPLLDLTVTKEMTGVYISYPIPASVKEASAAAERGPSRAH